MMAAWMQNLVRSCRLSPARSSAEPGRTKPSASHCRTTVATSSVMSKQISTCLDMLGASYAPSASTGI